MADGNFDATSYEDWAAYGNAAKDGAERGYELTGSPYGAVVGGAAGVLYHAYQNPGEGTLSEQPLNVQPGQVEPTLTGARGDAGSWVSRHPDVTYTFNRQPITLRAYIGEPFPGFTPRWQEWIGQPHVGVQCCLRGDALDPAGVEVLTTTYSPERGRSDLGRLPIFVVLPDNAIFVGAVIRLKQRLPWPNPRRSIIQDTINVPAGAPVVVLWYLNNYADGPDVPSGTGYFYGVNFLAPADENARIIDQPAAAQPPGEAKAKTGLGLALGVPAALTGAGLVLSMVRR